MKLLFFSSKTCAPCSMMQPIVEATTRKLNFPMKKLIASEHQTEFTNYSVTAVPTFILIDDNGKEVKRKTGIIPFPQFQTFLRG